MRVSKLSIWVMCLAMVLNSLTLFSFASEKVALNNSGSTEISMKAMRSVAASEGVSLAASEGDSGQFGYNIEPLDVDFGLYSRSYTDIFFYGYTVFLPAGSYSFTLSFNSDFYQLNVYNLYTSSNIGRLSDVLSSGSLFFVLDEPSSVRFYGAFYNDSVSLDDIQIIDFDLYQLTPVEGISSGYTFNSGVHDDDDVSARLEYVDWEFGNQPAGNYLINIYTYGQNYDVNFDIAVGGDVTSDRKLAVAKSSGLYTCLVSHGGGDLTLAANFTYSKDVLNSVGDKAVTGATGVNYNVSSGNWIFNITDVVAVPLESAGLEQFGIFGSIVGYLRDEFSSMKAWIATQIDKIAGDDATQAEVDSASSALQKEVDEVNELSNNLSSQTSNLEQQFTTDFAVPDEVSGSTSSIQLIYTGLFSSLGIFSIFIWLPVVFAVIKKLLRL